MGTVRGPGPLWGSADRGSVFSGYPLLVRITDKLLQNKIFSDEVLEKDAIEDFNKPRGIPREVYLTKLVKKINDLGLSFSVWNKKKKCRWLRERHQRIHQLTWISEKETS